MTSIVIIGAGQAGSSLASKLRTLGHDGEITLIGAEDDPPYQRPPLSKAYLLGEMERERLFLRPRDWYADQNIRLMTGAPVSAIDRAAKTIRFGGHEIGYDLLALTTGAIPNRLPGKIGGDLHQVFTIRTLADIDRLEPLVTHGARALVVGGGYIGLEAAAVARKRGVEVHLVEMAPRILGRVACAETADYFRALHREHGVEVLEETGLDHLTHAGDRLTGAVLTNGRTLPLDLVIAGTGIRPDTRLAETAGLTIDNGIACDAQGRTSDPAIFAAGDCASFQMDGGRMRLESVQNAIDMAEHVAAAMLGSDAPYRPTPWFWSDQYDVTLQIAGLGQGHDRIVTREGQGRARSHWYYKGDTLLAVDAMNAAKDYMVGRRLIEAGRTPDPAAVTDPGVDMKSLLRA